MDPKTLSSEVPRLGRRVEHSAPFEYAVRLGLVAWGLVYLLLGWLALQLALGDKQGAVSKKGALHQLAEQPLGKALLWVVAAGFAALVVWQALEASVGHRDRDGWKRWGARALSALRACIYATLGWTALQVAVGSGSTQGTDGYTARLMSMSMGSWLVGAVGLAIIAFGIGTAAKGVTDGYQKHLDVEARTGTSGSLLRGLARTGYLSRGIAFATMGGLFVWAAASHDPDRSGGLDQALARLLDAPLGPLLVGVVGAGFACFGLFCFAWAWNFRE